MLGAGREIIADYVAAGLVRVVYWPMLDLGPNSHNAAAAAFCAGEQGVDAFWQMHDRLFEQQSDVFRADRDDFVNTAVALNLDPLAFGQCYDDGRGHTLALTLDNARRELGIVSRPTFDINGARLLGNQPYPVFAATIDNALE